jgi:hypothetical protein
MGVEGAARLQFHEVGPIALIDEQDPFTRFERRGHVDLASS